MVVTDLVHAARVSRYQLPVLGMDAHGSRGGSGSPALPRRLLSDQSLEGHSLAVVIYEAAGLRLT